MPDPPTFSIINAVNADDLDALVGALGDQGFEVIRLDGRAVADKAGFLERADRDLPRPDDLHPHNWDALADTWWNGLVDLAEAGHDQIALVWTDADDLARADLETFLTAVDVLVRVAREVDPVVIVCTVGSGPEFRRLTA